MFAGSGPMITKFAALSVASTPVVLVLDFLIFSVRKSIDCGIAVPLT